MVGCLRGGRGVKQVKQCEAGGEHCGMLGAAVGSEARAVGGAGEASGPARVFVVGYGQGLREDDGAGVAAAEGVGARWEARGDGSGRAEVRIVTGVQLLPELASEIAGAELVVFLDARRRGGDEGVRFERVFGGGCGSGTETWTGTATGSGGVACAGGGVAHWAGPSGILALCRQLHGRFPEAWLISLPAREFGYREGLTDCARLGVAAAVELVDEWLARRLGQGKGGPVSESAVMFGLV
jgi:Ni,Fe-hydrogenase maturation factor